MTKIKGFGKKPATQSVPPVATSPTAATVEQPVETAKSPAPTPPASPATAEKKQTTLPPATKVASSKEPAPQPSKKQTPPQGLDKLKEIIATDSLPAKQPKAAATNVPAKKGHKKPYEGFGLIRMISERNEGSKTVHIIFQEEDGSIELAVFSANSGTMRRKELNELAIGRAVFIETNVERGKDGNEYHRACFLQLQEGVNYTDTLRTIAADTQKLVGASEEQLLSLILLSPAVQEMFIAANANAEITVEITEEMILNAFGEELPTSVFDMNGKPLFLFASDSDIATRLAAVAPTHTRRIAAPATATRIAATTNH